MNQKKRFSKDFLLVVIGQIISLFGNAVMRFALPIHLLNVTGSAALLGIVSGCAFVPLAVMSPLGGIIADRVNKRTIMVSLDFFTAGLTVLFLFLYGKVSLVGLVLVMLFLLYGISGAYQPSVQASIPLLVPEEQIMAGNAAINMVSSLSGLLGPALGGVAYSLWGIYPVLAIAACCFVFSAVMEIFIKIPHKKRKGESSWVRQIRGDMGESLNYITTIRADIGKLGLSCAAINLFLSSLFIIGMPVIVTQALGFPDGTASRLYGYLEAIMAAGGLAGGAAAGIFGKRLKVQESWKLLFLSGILLLPDCVALALGVSSYLTYGVVAVSGLVSMAVASMYTIQAMAYIQMTVPEELVGKVISLAIALSTCAQPIGQVMYGFLFEKLAGNLWLLFLAAGIVTMVVGLLNRRVAKRL